ncbi:MAG: hypothetical protein H6680_09545 [Desulfobacteraceae bacterium]|nr:hypothetical protein [Desulfobacteraceae bacterium]
MTTFKELLEEKNDEKKESERLFFISDDELNKVEEILIQLEDGRKVFDPILLYQKASILGYWCEADYNDNTGGYFFEKI